MKKLRNTFGYTMAEVLIVIAILGILASVTVVGVIQYRRALTKLEYDNYAKEIFIAAQNHLTSASAQGYYAQVKSGFGVKETPIDGIEDTGNGTYYYVVQNSSEETDQKLSSPTEVLSIVLPFGSIDETVRLGGSYLIRYHKDSGQVLDVFFWKSTSNYAYAYQEADYPILLGYRGEAYHDVLQNYNGSVIGYYGGTEADNLTYGKELKKPVLTIHNEDILYAEIKDPNTDNPNAKLKLLLTGKTSQVQKEIVLDFSAQTQKGVYYDTAKKQYVVVLDDITQPNLHFSQLFCNPFSGSQVMIPGEDIQIQAVAYNTSERSNVAYTSEYTTNSLFGEVQKEEAAEDDATAILYSIRHLENLDAQISNMNKDSRVTIAAATQITDLNWTSFQQNAASFNKEARHFSSSTAASVCITNVTGETNTLYNQKGCFYPINPSFALLYNAMDDKNAIHSITAFAINQTDAEDQNAGLFGTLPSGSIVKNLILTDASVTGANAGVLAGMADHVTIQNVSVFRHNQDGETAENRTSAYTVSGTGDVGGLVGVLSNSQVEHASASVMVTSSAGNAGGLAGNAVQCTIQGCYSGGYTNNGRYRTDILNVVGTQNAGGLIGVMNNTTVRNSYSTCSVSCSGTGYVGGFLGSGSGQVANCYATGLVQGVNATQGAFSGAAITGNTPCQDCYYYSIINERFEEDTFVYLEDPNETGVAALDANRNILDAKLQKEQEKDTAVAYDSILHTYYHGKYILTSVPQLEQSTQPAANNLVAVHYGDWPAPELWVFN